MGEPALFRYTQEYKNTTDVASNNTASPDIFDWDKYLKQFGYNKLVDDWGIFTKVWVSQSALIIFSNVICLFVIATIKELRRNYSNWFLIGVMLSHIIKGCSFIIYSYDIYRDLIFNIFMDSMALSLIFLTLMTLDRYLAIKHSFVYHTLTWRYATSAMTVALLPLIGFSVFVYISSQKQLKGSDFYSETVVVLGVTTLIVGIILIYTNYNVFGVAKCQLSNIATTIVKNTPQERKAAKNNIKKRKLKAIGICMVITMSFIIFWLPYFVFTFLDLTGILDSASRNQNGDNLRFWLHMGSWFCGGMNSLIDPIIYEYFNNDVRRYLNRRIFTRSKNRRISRISTDTNITERSF